MPQIQIQRKLAIAIKDTEEDTTLAELTAIFLLPSSIGPMVEAKGDTAYAVVEIDNEEMKKAMCAALKAAGDQLARMEVSAW